MVVAAQQYEVVEVRVTPCCPVHDVVRVEPALGGATGEGTATVSDAQRTALCPVRGTRVAPDCEGLAVLVVDEGLHHGVATRTPGGVDAHRGAVGVVAAADVAVAGVDSAGAPLTRAGPSPLTNPLTV